MTAGTRGARVQVAVATVAGLLLGAGTVLHVTRDRDSATVAGATVAAPAPPPLTAAVDPASPAPTGPWKIVWSDEFAGTGPADPTKWFAQTGDRDGWGVGGKAYYDPAQAARTGDGTLAITAVRDTSGQQCWYGPCEYRSARIQSAGRFDDLRYGRYEARIKFPTGKSLFSAFWLQSHGRPYGSKKYAEIDIAEIYGLHERDILGAAHQEEKVIDTRVVLRRPLDTRFHTVGVNWTPDRITWTIDGRPYGTLKRYKGWSMNQAVQIILNLQIGGDWQGDPDAGTPFPAALNVDWVRVYQKEQP